MEATVDAEKRLLVEYLDGQRRHILQMLEGLDDAALRRSLLPSGWSLLGLVHHLAWDVERFWFGAVVAGDPSVIDRLPDISNAWEVDPSRTAGEVIGAYREAIELADRVIAATPLDAPPRWWPDDLFGDFRMGSLRQVILHTMTETACHAGHLDIVRELIDGKRWMVLTG